MRELVKEVMKTLQSIRKVLLWRIRFSIPLAILLAVVAATTVATVKISGLLHLHERALDLGFTKMAEEDYGWGLPSDVDRIVLHEIADLDPYRRRTNAATLLELWPTVDQIELSDSSAKLFSDVWRKLHFDSALSALCHDPGFILQFFKGSDLYLETSLCLHCQNFLVPTHVGRRYMGFQLRSPEGTNLVESLKALFPNSDKWKPEPVESAPIPDPNP